ncbi:MAG: acyl-CoA dehydrogenase family protein [Acidimicrobiales bacterium]
MSISVEAFRTRATEFIDASIASGVACPAFGTIMPPGVFDQARAWQRAIFTNGFAGVDWATDCGGQGLSLAHRQAWSGAWGPRSVAPYMNFQGFILAAGAIRRYGTEAQRQQYLRDTLAADIVWCQLFSEPGSGSDLVSLSTKAVSTGDGWVVTGEKVWSSTAQLADYGILLARTDADQPGHRGISFFLFDMHGPGVEVRPITQMTGDQEFCQVFLDEAPVRADCLLGPLNGGWAVATSVLADERSEVGARGIALRRDLAGLRNGAPDELVVRDQLMNLTVEGTALAELLDRSVGDPRLGPLIKLALTELETDITRFRVDTNGANGMLMGEATEPFLYAPGMRVAGGTSEIQRNLIGERLLGLPREPSPAR